MPLARKEPPAGIQEVIADSASLLDPILDAATLQLLSENEGGFFLGPIYNLGADEVLNGASLSSGHLTAWTYLLPDAEGRPTGLEIAADERKGVSPRSAQLVRGPFIESTAQVMRRLDELAAARPYTLRFLRIPALGLFASWLRDDLTQADIFVPLAPTPRGINAGEAYSGEKLAQPLRARAQNLATQDPEGDS